MLASETDRIDQPTGGAGRAASVGAPSAGAGSAERRPPARRSSGPRDPEEAVVAVGELVTREVAALALENRICYQCGQCTAACPSGGDLGSGPRRLMRLILTEQIEQLLASDDLWRCSGCGSCSAACPMELDVAGALARLRALERAHGGQRCPEREAATVATRRLSGHDKIDSMAFGAAMAARGFVPNDMVGAAGAASRLMARRLRRRDVATPRRASAGPPGAPPRRSDAGAATRPARRAARPFYPGCALLQDTAAADLTRAVARGLGLALAEAPDARLLRPSQPGRERRGLRQRRDRDHRLSGLRPQPRGERHPRHASLGGARRPRQALRRRPARRGAGLRALRRLPGRARARARTAWPARPRWPASIA